MPELDLETVLRDLPRPAFKKALRESLAPQSVTPYLVVRMLDDLVNFMRDAFGAEELMRATGSAGGTHCEVRLSDSKIMVGGGPKLSHAEMPSSLHYYVPDVDAAYRRAIESGAKSLMPPRDQEYGDRDCAIEDLAGNQWYIGTSRGAAYKPPGLRSVTLYLHPNHADKLIEFVERAFGAETLERYASPEGAVAHAKMKIANSMVEMAEAHDQWPPMPTMIYMTVDDPDAAYARAMEAGAESIMPPTQQPYGARVGAVRDAAGNQWYLAGEAPNS